MATLQERITEVVTAIGREIKNLKGVQTEVETIAGKVELLEQCCEELKNQTPAPEDPDKVKEWTEALGLIREDKPQLTTEEQKNKTRRWMTETYRIEGSKHYIDLYTYIDSVKFTLELDFFADKATITGEEGTVVWISKINTNDKYTEVGRIGPDNKLEVDISNLPYSNLPYSTQSIYYFTYNNPAAYGNFDNQTQFNIGKKKNYYNVVTSLEGKAYFVINQPTGFTFDKFKQNNPNLANLTYVTIGNSGNGVVDFRSPEDYLPFQFNSGAQKYATVNLVPLKFKHNNALGGYTVPYPNYGTVIYTEEIDPNKRPPFMFEAFNIGDVIISGNDIRVYIKCDTCANNSGGMEYLFDTYLSNEGWTKYYSSYGYYDLVGSYGFEMKRPFNKTKFNRMTVGSYDDDMRIKKISDTEIDLYVYKGISEEETDFLTVRLNLLDANESQNDNKYFSLNNRNPFYVSTFHDSSRHH